MAYTRGQGIGRIRGDSATAPQKQVGTDRRSLVRAGECGRGSLPSTWRSPRPARCLDSWGRGGDGAERAWR